MRGVVHPRSIGRDCSLGVIIRENEQDVWLFRSKRTGTQPIPSGPIRAYAEERSKKDLGGVLCHATIVFGDGFRVATMRSVLSGIIVVQHSPFPRRVFSSVGEAAVWTSKFAGAAPGYVQGLVEAVRQAQERTQKP